MNLFVFHFRQVFYRNTFRSSHIHYPLDQMSTRIIFSSNHENNKVNGNLVFLSCTGMLIGFKLTLLDQEFLAARQSFFPLSSNNTTTTSNYSRCEVPFDDCRCSMVSNKSDTTMKCITDGQAISAHIMPLISYVIQLFIIYRCVSITGKYSRILTDLFWITTLVVFVVIGITVHGSDCVHNNTATILGVSSVLISGTFYVVFCYSLHEQHLNAHRNTSRDQRLETIDQNRNNHYENFSSILTKYKHFPCIAFSTALMLACYFW